MDLKISSISAQTRSLILQASALVTSFVILYSGTVMEMARNWQRDENFSHGFLIPFITGLMIWQRRDQLAQQKATPANWGLLIVLAAMGMHIAGSLSAEMFVMRSSLIVCLGGMIVYFFGSKVFAIISIPVAYLFFMVPIPKIIWNPIAFPLQLMAAKLSSVGIQILGIPVLREGNILHLSNVSLEVVDACSGLRSLVSLLALSGAFSYMTNLDIPRKIILFLSAVPIAILVNILRLTFTGILARYAGAEAAKGFLHELSGLVVFVLACVFLYSLKVGLSSLADKPGKSS